MTQYLASCLLYLANPLFARAQFSSPSTLPLEKNGSAREMENSSSRSQ